MIPDNWYLLKTRGVAEYRAGQFQPALATLSRSKELYADLYARRIGRRSSLVAATIGLGTLLETFLGAISIFLRGETTMQYLAAEPSDLAFLAMAHHQLGHQLAPNGFSVADG